VDAAHIAAPTCDHFNATPLSIPPPPVARPIEPLTPPITPARSGHRAAVIASFLGWTLDAFDYWLVAYTLTAIAKEFGQTDKAIAFSITLTLFFRPIGAIISVSPRIVSAGEGPDGESRFLLGHGRADRLRADLTAFLVVRALFGIGMGGEWGVGSSLAMEKTDKRRRGIVSGLLQEGYACGNLLAAICYFFVFPRWGWRPMFFIGGLPALLAFYVRLYVTESEVWERTRHKNWGDYTRVLASNWPLFAYLFVFLTFMGFVSHGTQDMYPTFLKRDWNFTPQRVATIGMIANIGAILGGIIFGHFSDKIGRRRRS
jgi:SHS family lactate transporter-like MFS transporter